MPKRLTQKDFETRAKLAHNGKYDYSKVVYTNNYTKVCIICPIHGEFWQVPHNHLRGYGCLKCVKDKQKSIIYGVGINDCDVKGKSYSVWHDMIQRCYSDSCKSKYSSYLGCTVCEEWQTFSNFKRWFDENYVEGCDLDKDILVKGNKVYSPNTCAFIPHRINTLLISCKMSRGKLPIGVSYYDKGNKYQVKLRLNGKKKHIGYFTTKEEAFEAYKNAKEKYIKEIALEYYHKGLITFEVFYSLTKWEIEITD